MNQQQKNRQQPKSPGGGGGGGLNMFYRRQTFTLISAVVKSGHKSTTNTLATVMSVFIMANSEDTGSRLFVNVANLV